MLAERWNGEGGSEGVTCLRLVGAWAGDVQRLGGSLKEIKESHRASWSQNCIFKLVSGGEGKGFSSGED